MNTTQVAFNLARAAQQLAHTSARDVIDTSPLNGDARLLDPVKAEKHLQAHELAQELWAAYSALKALN